MQIKQDVLEPPAHVAPPIWNNDIKTLRPGQIVHRQLADIFIDNFVYENCFLVPIHMSTECVQTQTINVGDSLLTIQWNLSKTTTKWDISLPSGAHLDEVQKAEIVCKSKLVPSVFIKTHYWLNHRL